MFATKCHLDQPCRWRKADELELRKHVATQCSAKLCFKTPFGVHQWDFARCKWETFLNSPERNATDGALRFSHNATIFEQPRLFVCQSKVDTVSVCLPQWSWPQCIKVFTMWFIAFAMIKTSVMFRGFVSEFSLFSDAE